MEADAWNSHQWSIAKRCGIDIEPGKPVIQHHCSRCRRDFVEDQLSGERYAVYVSVFSFRRFPDSITKQWLRELCPGAPPVYDIEVCSKLIEREIVIERERKRGLEISDRRDE
jgi:hypothetical protein